MSVLTAGLILLISGASLHGEDRYTMVFRDGTVKTGDEIHDWHREKDQPRIDNHRLFSGNNDVRMIRDRANDPQRRGAHVELLNGDLLPGDVMGYVAATEDVPAHLLVLARELKVEGNRAGIVRVRLDALRRVVWAERTEPAGQIASLVLTDGRRVPIDALRWGDREVRALTDGGLLNVAWSELAWIDFASSGRIAAVLEDQRRAFAKGGKDELIGRIVMTSGAMLTWLPSEMSYRRERHDGQHWSVHVIKPHWSLDALHVPTWEVVSWSFRRSDEIPLSLLQAELIEHQSFTGYRWNWRQNTGLRGQRLKAGDLSSDLGLGMPARMALAIDLPEGSKNLSTWVGIDESVGDGGCVSVSVYRDRLEGRPAWEKQFLTGDKAPERVDRLDVSRAKRVIFLVDFAHEGRPKGADPLDIRDEVSWLMLLVEIDPKSLSQSAE